MVVAGKQIFGGSRVTPVGRQTGIIAGQFLSVTQGITPFGCEGDESATAQDELFTSSVISIEQIAVRFDCYVFVLMVSDAS